MLLKVIKPLENTCVYPDTGLRNLLILFCVINIFGEEVTFIIQVHSFPRLLKASILRADMCLALSSV